MSITLFFFQFSIYEWVIIGLYLFFFLVQLIYYLYLFRKPYQHYVNNKTTSKDNDLNKKNFPGITVIITAKNEAENLRKNLPLILNQDYPNYQVVVVDNGSTDSTNDVLNNFRQHHTNLYITYLPIESEKVNSKKLALTIGIKAAKHDILVFTEADVRPLSKGWVYEYAESFHNGIEIVLGCCQYNMDKGLFKKYIQYDNLFNGVKYLSMALIKKPYLGIGRNMAFKKNLFFDNNGFAAILNIEDGEDDVYINRIATKENTTILTSKESMVESSIIDGFSTWKNTKTKYLSTRKHLTGSASKLLAFEVFSRYAFYLLFVTLCLIGMFSSIKVYLLLGILLFTIRLLTQLIIINKNGRIYNTSKFHFTLPLFDLFIPIVDYMYLLLQGKRKLK